VVDEERSIRKLQLLAPKIRNHKDLETKITSAPPHLRMIIYEIVRPHLTFEAWPLDKYIISAKQMAEREKLPTMDEAGRLWEFQPPQDVKTAEKAIAAALAVRTLTLTCGKCTVQEQFHAIGNESNVDVILKARAIGWIYDYKADPQREICPKCPTELRVVN